jgi:hypothetical protein
MLVVEYREKNILPRIKICETLREWDDEIEIQKNIYQPVQNDDT